MIEHDPPTRWPLLALALACPPGGIAAEPLYVKNLSPVAGLLGFPSQRGAATGRPGTLAVALHGALASHYVEDSGGGEAVRLDGETARLALELRYALAADWEVQLELPWLKHSGGDLDSLIDDWHDLWGMSDGGRSRAPRDRISYRYRGAGGEFALVDGVSGAGDVTLALNNAFWRGESARASLALGYKFGTGDADELLGSGADDLYVALRWSADARPGLPLDWHAQLGWLRAGRWQLPGVAPERDLWFAGLTVAWPVGERWSLLAQLDSHAAPAQSDLAALGDDAVLLSAGARWQFAPRWSLDLGLVEDIRVETAPDITFQGSLRYR
jgi:hypothetical protein